MKANWKIIIGFIFLLISLESFSQTIGQTTDVQIVSKDSTTWRFENNQELRVKGFPPYLIEKGLQNDSLLQMGYLNVKYYAKGDGKTDDYEMIMKALDDCFKYELVAYFPEGTYLISKSLNCYKKFKTYTKGFFLVGDPHHRPVIKLMDNALDFQNEKALQYVLNLWQWDTRSGRPDKEFGAAFMNSAGVSSIIIDCGKGNSGAVGFKCWGSQGMYVENLTVKAYGAYAGIQNLIGNGGYMASIEVLGGKYGIWALNGQPGAIAGLTLIDQDLASIRQDMASWPYSIVGFKIVKEKGPIVILDKKQKQLYGFHLSLVDGTIEFKSKGSTAFIVKKDEDKRAGNLYLQDVYVKNAAVLVEEDNEKPLLAKPTGWSHIAEFSSSSSDTENFVDGEKIQGSISSIDNKTPQTNFLTKHSLPEYGIPFGLDIDAKNVKDLSLGQFAAMGDGKTDDTQAIQYAIDNYSKVFLPKGDYRITSALILKKNTVLFGITSALSAIIPDNTNWKNGAEKTLISTVNDAKAKCVLSQLTVYSSSLELNGGYQVIDWKAGRNSIVKNIYTHSSDLLGIGWPTVETVWDKGVITRPVNINQLVRISENGGGKWYGCAFGCENYYPVVPRTYHHLLITNTKEPLRLYSLNPEHACSDTEVEIENSKNIQIFGVKTEGNEGCEFNTFGKEVGALITITNSENILVTASGNNGKNPPSGKSLYKIVNCKNIVFSTCSAAMRSVVGDYKNLSEQIDGQNKIEIPAQKNVGLFRRGNLVRF